MLHTCQKQLVNTTEKLMDCKCSTIAIALFFVLPVVTVAQKTSADQKPPAPLGKLVDVGGYRVHLYCTGAGNPVVVIVGTALSSRWNLVQAAVAKFAQVCSYDHSGAGWSDPGPKDSCSLRVVEVHAALKNAGVKGPYVLVGHSVGGLVARLYAERYPEEVAGMVFVDHAGHLSVTLLGVPQSDATAPPPLPPLSRAGIVPECFAEVDSITKEHAHPLGDKPLVNVSTDEDRSPDYVKLQTLLLSLSQNSKEIIADKSGHFVMVDRPDVVIDAISQAVRSIRSNAKL